MRVRVAVYDEDDGVLFNEEDDVEISRRAFGLAESIVNRKGAPGFLAKAVFAEAARVASGMSRDSGGLGTDAGESLKSSIINAILPDMGKIQEDERLREDLVPVMSPKDRQFDLPVLPKPPIKRD